MSHSGDDTHIVRWTQDKINSFWGRYATIRMKYHPELNWFSGAYDRLHVEIRKYMPKNSRLLDVGCGGGYSVVELTKRGFYVVGMESDEYQLELYAEYCGKNKVGVNAIRGLLWRLPFDDNAFDCVYCCDVLEHIIPEYLPKGMAELRRVLKPGGYYFVLIPRNEDMFQNMALCPECGAWFHRHQHFQNFDEEKLNQLLVKSKFKIIELFACTEISGLTNKTDNVELSNVEKIIAVCQKR